MLKKIQQLSPLTLVMFLVLFHIVLYFCFRLVLFYFVEPEIIDRCAIFEALYIGLKFDGRYAVFTVLPLALALLFPALECRIYAPKSFLRFCFCFLQTVIFSFILLAHIFDLGVYFYLQQRLDMSLVDFIENPYISALMVWQSYPVIWIMCAFLLILYAYYCFWNILLKKQKHRIIVQMTSWKNSQFLSAHFFSEIKRILSIKDVNTFSLAVSIRIFSCIFLFVVAYGQMSSNLFPLRWSNAYLSADKKIPLIALHPVQNLYDTMHISKVVDPDIDSVLEVFPSMARYLGVTEEDIARQVEKFKDFSLDKAQKKLPVLDFTRHTPLFATTQNQSTSKEAPLNIVLLMMESLTTPRSSLPHGTASIDNYQGFGDLPKELDLDATPFLAELIKEALYYPNFYANARTTARGIFSTITGIPDVNFSGGTSSRNPKVVDQKIIFNEFKDYQKYYLIGGNANWANIRGLLQSNITDLQLLEESYWKAPNVDVWGISDLALMREAVTLFNESKKPFIAFIQTAGFHRPYTIPTDNEGFEFTETPSQEALDYWGFENEAEFHSMRFADHALRRFFARAKEESWFENTVFIIFGDHGLTKTSYNMSSSYLREGLQFWHTPVFIYSPSRVITGINPALHSQADIFPTLANMAGIEFDNTTLGRNMLTRLPHGMFIPKEFSEASLVEHANNKEMVPQYIYNSEKDKALENRVYIAQNEGDIFLLLDGYLYHLKVNDKENAGLYDLISEVKNEKHMPSKVNFSSKEQSVLSENLVNINKDLAEEFYQKTMDFYHSAKYLLQNNKK